MTTILLTCGRGAYALALARTIHAAGHRVLVADAWPRSLCCYSRTVSRYFQVPSPARLTGEWMRSLLRIVDAEGVDLIVPVYEESFYLAQAVATLPDPPAVFAAPFETLIALHNKWLFVERARALGLAVPATTYLTSRADLERAFLQRNGRDKVYKPVYSRFARHTVVRPQRTDELDGIDPTPQTPWVAQEFVPGRPFASFSVAHKGRIACHATYALDFCHHLGPTSVYRRADHPAVFAWARTFVEATQYTGQIGLDFIEDEAGRVSAIECNPRLTGGMFLLKDDPGFAASYLKPGGNFVDASDRTYAFRFLLFCSLFHHTSSFPGLRKWCRHLFSARSTNEFVWTDPLPLLMSPFLACWFLYRCFAEKETARSLVTRDFEWSKERIAAALVADSAGSVSAPAA